MDLPKIIVLSIVVFIAYTIQSGGSNSAAQFAALVALVGAVVLYFSPWLVALKRAHPKVVAIGVLNLFAGWTVIGWVGALTWAYTGSVEKPAPPWVQAPAPEPQLDGRPQAPAVAAPAVKKCPYCAEEVRIEAIRCKHCKSDLAAA